MSSTCHAHWPASGPHLISSREKGFCLVACVKCLPCAFAAANIVTMLKVLLQFVTPNYHNNTHCDPPPAGPTLCPCSNPHLQQAFSLLLPYWFYALLTATVPQMPARAGSCLVLSVCPGNLHCLPLVPHSMNRPPAPHPPAGAHSTPEACNSLRLGFFVKNLFKTRLSIYSTFTHLMMGFICSLPPSHSPSPRSVRATT